jgi:hypothetical protein
MDHGEFLAQIDHERDVLARALCILALEREMTRRQIEREHAQLAPSLRARMQNTEDLCSCVDMLVEIKEHLIKTKPVVTRGTERLLARLIGALHDTIVGSKPALFLDIEPKNFWRRGPEGTKTGSSMADAGKGIAAFILDLLMSAMPKAEAIAWLDRKIPSTGFVDRSQRPVAGKRIADWRKNFARGKGAALGCRMLEIFRKEHAALLRAPKSELKTRRVLELAGMLLDRLATNSRGDIPGPQGDLAG